jgi:hypothetical protein
MRVHLFIFLELDAIKEVDGMDRQFILLQLYNLSHQSCYQNFVLGSFLIFPSWVSHIFEDLKIIFNLYFIKCKRFQRLRYSKEDKFVNLNHHQNPHQISFVYLLHYIFNYKFDFRMKMILKFDPMIFLILDHQN